MLITLTKQIILTHNLNFNEKTLICFKKLNKKNQIISIFQESRPNWNKTKLEDQRDIFEKK